MSREETDWLPVWSIPVGTLFGVRIRISLLFPAIAVILCGWYGVRAGLSMTTILLFASMWHAQGRYLGACLCGFANERITLWPAGCLDREDADESRASLYSNLGGIFANVLVCTIFSLPLAREGRLFDAMDPFKLGSFQLTTDSWSNVLYLQFAMNWMLVVVNLVPLPPFCLGRILSQLSEKLLGIPTGEVVFRKLAIGLAIAVLLTGLYLELSLVVALAGLSLASILFSTPVEVMMSEDETETFLGYDFSEGYTSLNRSIQNEPPKSPPSFLQRWRDSRNRLRREREEEFDREVDRELDRILAKVHESGMTSLTEHEQRLLDRASEKFRSKMQPSE